MAKKDSTLANSSTNGATNARKSTAQDQEDHHKDRRDHESAVAIGGVADIEVDSGAATDQDVGADGIEVGTQAVDHLIGGLGVGRHTESREEHRVALNDLGGPLQIRRILGIA